MLGGDGLQARIHSVLHKGENADVPIKGAAGRSFDAPDPTPEELIPLDNEDFKDF